MDAGIAVDVTDHTEAARTPRKEDQADPVACQLRNLWSDSPNPIFPNLLTHLFTVAIKP
jgi:hypothetical protein